MPNNPEERKKEDTLDTLLWFWCALASAFFQVVRNMMMKKVGHALNADISAWARVATILPFAMVPVWWQGVPVVQGAFWVIVLCFGFSQSVATFALAKALHASPISLVTALWKLSVLLLLIANLLAGDPISWLGGVGAAISVVGVYLLNIEKSHISWLAPLAAIWHEPGQRWTLLASFGYMVSVVLIKEMAQLSNTFYAVLMGYIACVLVTSPYTLYSSKAQFGRLPRYWKRLLFLGFTGTVSTWFGTYAYTLTASAYVESVKQVEVLFAMAIGWVFFQEKTKVKAIWPGVLVLFLGLILVKLGS